MSKPGYTYLTTFRLASVIYELEIGERLGEKQIRALEEKHMKEGGFTEKLYQKRVEYRKKNGQKS